MTHTEALWTLAAIFAFILFVKARGYRLFFIPWFFIPGDEFHSTYLGNDMRFDPIESDTPRWVRWCYTKNLTWRRRIAHRRDLESRGGPIGDL